MSQLNPKSPKFCWGCGATITVTQKFCTRCGKSLNKPNQTPGSSPDIDSEKTYKIPSPNLPNLPTEDVTPPVPIADKLKPSPPPENVESPAAVLPANASSLDKRILNLEKAVDRIEYKINGLNVENKVVDLTNTVKDLDLGEKIASIESKMSGLSNIDELSAIQTKMSLMATAEDVQGVYKKITQKLDGYNLNARIGDIEAKLEGSQTDQRLRQIEGMIATLVPAEKVQELEYKIDRISDTINTMVPALLKLTEKVKELQFSPPRPIKLDLPPFPSTPVAPSTPLPKVTAPPVSDSPTQTENIKMAQPTPQKEPIAE